MPFFGLPGTRIILEKGEKTYTKHIYSPTQAFFQVVNIDKTKNFDMIQLLSLT